MASQAYYTWVNAGRPWRPARPILELEAWAHSNGVGVLGTIGNEEHLQAVPPQDHTPYSATAWPVKLPGYIVTAIDLANVNGLGPAIETQARQGKLPWLKYMNHSGRHLDSRDLDGDGITWEVYPSSDQHVHLSIRTDWIDKSIGTFNPWGDTVIVKWGDKDADKVHGEEVARLQCDLILLDDKALPNYGPDGEYGDETAEWVSRLVTGGDGKTFGGRARSQLDDLLRRKAAGSGNVLPGTLLTLSVPASTVQAKVQ